MMTCGFLIIAFACTFKEHEVSFWFSLISSIMLGIGCALGESTILGFCKGFPSSTVGYFASGTGFAGIFGSGIILILKAAGLDNGQIFFSIAPCVIPYFLSFWWIYWMKSKYPYVHVEHPDKTVASPHTFLTSESDLKNEDRALVDNQVNAIGDYTTNSNQMSEKPLTLDEAKNNIPLNFVEFKKVFVKIGFF